MSQSQGMPPKKRRKEALALAGTLALIFFSHPSRVEIIWLSIPSGLLLAYGFSGWATKKTLGVAERMGRCVVLFVACYVCVFLYAWHFWPKVDNEKAGVLFVEGSVTSSNVIVEIGSSGTFLVPDKTFELFKGDDALTVRSNGGVLKVSTKVRDSHGNVIAWMNDNEWKMGLGSGVLDWNHNDEALEVLDGKGDVVLQVSLKQKSNIIQLQGKWRSRSGVGLALVQIYGKPGYPSAIENVLPGQPFQQTISPMFKYPSEFHLGETVQ